MTGKTKAKDLMTAELVVGSENITIEEAIKLLVNNRITGFPIVNRDNKIIGVLSELDIIKTMENSTDAKGVDLASPALYTRVVKTVQENADWKEILDTFLDKKIRRLPVVDKEGHIKGIITRRDIMKAIFYKNKSNGPK